VPRAGQPNGITVCELHVSSGKETYAVPLSIELNPVSDGHKGLVKSGILQVQQYDKVREVTVRRGVDLSWCEVERLGAPPWSCEVRYICGQYAKHMPP
jgi:hypothetical protein